MPKLHDTDNHKLRSHQLAVLLVLDESAGPLTRIKLTERTELSSARVSQAIGYRNNIKRVLREIDINCPSLLTLGYVEEVELDIEGYKETAYLITPSGRSALNAAL